MKVAPLSGARRPGISANGVGSFKEIDMYEIQEFRPNSKEVAVGILAVLVLLVVVFGIGYGLGLRNAGTDINDNGNGIDAVREQYQHIEVNQRQITDGLAGAVERSDNAAERAERIEERAGAAAQSVTDAGVLIDECQQIIGNIRNRGKTYQAKH